MLTCILTIVKIGRLKFVPKFSRTIPFCLNGEKRKRKRSTMNILLSSLSGFPLQIPFSKGEYSQKPGPSSGLQNITSITLSFHSSCYLVVYDIICNFHYAIIYCTSPVVFHEIPKPVVFRIWKCLLSVRRSVEEADLPALSILNSLTWGSGTMDCSPPCSLWFAPLLAHDGFPRDSGPSHCSSYQCPCSPWSVGS